MYLKTLELQGFKSFADKTSINLHKGIAAIVGPNGSGKSNVVEAIQWVLGEQKAKTLRGHKMEDLIFNGTKLRKPMGMAEVSLILDNSDFGFPLDVSEIKVTRRLYRSGDGEYLINGKNCRLKDIHRLFADSGIGNDGYSVIGQGRISQIVEARPDERRAMVEETAGVVKYRERKKEALRKISSANDNLLRLADIMTEIESRLSPLERDAENAKKYLELKKEKDDLSIGILAENTLEAKEKLEKITAESDEIRGKSREISAVVLAEEISLDKKNLTLSQMADTLQSKQQEYHELSQSIQTAEGEMKSLESRILGYDEKLSLLEQECTVLEEKSILLESSLSEGQKESEALSAYVDALKSEMSELEVRRVSEEEALMQAEAIVERLRAEAFDKTREISGCHNEKAGLEQALNSIARRLAALEEKSIRYDKEEEILDLRTEEINDFLDGLSAKEDALHEKILAARNHYESIEKQITSKKEDETTSKMEVNRCEARLKVLEELVFRREGFYPGVKAILEESSQKRLGGVIGVMAELVKVDKNFTVAVESALGGGLQNLVTRTGEDAAKAVAFLKKNKRGSATFLPLNMLRISSRKSLPKEIASHPSFLGVAADRVNCSREVRPAVEYLLGNTLIFQNLDDAVATARDVKIPFRYVTSDGDMISGGGAVSGGSRDGKKSSFLQRQSEIDELRHKLIESSENIKVLQQEIESLLECRENAKRNLAQMEHQREGLQKEKISFDSEIQNIDTRREVYVRERESLALDVSQLHEEQRQSRESLSALEHSIASLQKEESAIYREIEEREAALQSAKSKEDQGRSAFTDLRVSYTEQRAALNHCSENLQRMEKERAEVLSSLEEKQKEMNDTRTARSEMEHRCKALRDNAISQNRSLAEFSAILEDLKIKHGEAEEEKNHSEQHLRTLRREESEYKEKEHQLSLRRERLSVEAEQCETQLWEEYETVLADAIAYCRPELGKKEKKERIKSLKDQINMLGNVNVGAIEEFQTVSERYEFLTEQRTDVLEAKAALEKVVGEMDEIISARFAETFQKIDESFRQTFPAFFRGGHGELRLTDPDHLLESGVEVIVQPPGKRLQHHGLLSGGELALSGIALLFAILKVKSSPFYVLDEIDAALDDVNVRKFGAYLKEYGADSQFLVITHRQGTMESAQELYGITMAEEGVSKTVSVRLEQ